MSGIGKAGGCFAAVLLLASVSVPAAGADADRDGRQTWVSVSVGHYASSRDGGSASQISLVHARSSRVGILRWALYADEEYVTTSANDDDCGFFASCLDGQNVVRLFEQAALYGRELGAARLGRWGRVRLWAAAGVSRVVREWELDPAREFVTVGVPVELVVTADVLGVSGLDLRLNANLNREERIVALNIGLVLGDLR